MSADTKSISHAMPVSSDLHVERVSDALLGKTVDLVVSGSIAAVESVRLIRYLRRLSAEVHPWLTSGGSQFITPLALTWAAANPTRTSFSGDASHIALHDACVVAPASANLIAKAAQGITDTPSTALIASYLGQKKPLLILPNMHDSLAMSPAFQANLERLQQFGAVVLPARAEEGKQKFPAPELLADQIAHLLRHRERGETGIALTMGTTRGYVDQVRYLSNYSSGALGSAIAEELYRQGIATTVICGPCPVQPRTYTKFYPVETNTEMQTAILAACRDSKIKGAIFAASVLDFAPKSVTPGKIPSSQAHLTIECLPTQKIIGLAQPQGPIKIGFKLEVDLNEQKAEALAAAYAKKYGLSAVIVNDLADVDRQRHQAWVFIANEGELMPAATQRLNGKRQIASVITQHVIARLS